MDSLDDIFRDEAREYLETIERTSLDIKSGEDVANLEPELFRVLHTLKGSAGMVGFGAVAELVHLLESYLGSRNLLTCGDILLRCHDHIQKLLEDKDCANGENISEQRTLLELLAVDNSLQRTKDAATEEQPSPAAELGQKRLFYIYFAPRENLLNNGIRHEHLIEDLAKLGVLYTRSQENMCADVEESSEFPSQAWHFLLHTEEGKAAVQDIFLFVAHLSTLEIIPLVGNIPELIYRFENATLEALSAEWPLQAEAQTNNLSKPDTGLKKAKPGSIRVDAQRVDELLDLVGELSTEVVRLQSLVGNHTGDGLAEITPCSEQIDKLTARLRDNTFSFRLISLHPLSERLRRVVQDTAEKLGKPIEWQVSGMDTQLDKQLVDTLFEALLHLVRNSIDHGIEADAADRAANGKSATGTLRFSAENLGNTVRLELQDDGAGIDTQKLRNRAIEQGVITENDKLDNQLLLDLVFSAGLSTKKEVTDISGRGVGLDVVKSLVDSLRGTIDVRSTPGKGTSFILQLPCSVAMVEALQVCVGATQLMVPVEHILKCYQMPSEQVFSRFNQLVEVDGEVLPYINLFTHFPEPEIDREYLTLIIVPYKQEKYVLVVEKAFHITESVVKPLPHAIEKAPWVSGGCMLGNGTVALVIQPQTLITHHRNLHTIVS